MSSIYNWDPHDQFYQAQKTQKSMDCKQTNRNIGALYVNIISRVDS